MATFRPQRGLLEESLRDATSVDSVEDICLWWNQPTRLGRINPEDIEVKFYAHDNRIPADCFMVTHKGNAIGFTDQVVERKKH